MGGPDKKDKTRDGKSGTPPPQATEDNDVEDGDFATPKRDIESDDDQPL
jgi:hypothetical protein